MTVYFNQSGNGWSAGRATRGLPGRGRRRRDQVVDLLGNGTACLVWSSPLPGAGDPAAALRRSDGRPEAAPAGPGGQQPRRRDDRALRTVDPVLPGRQAAGRPWVTRLPFPVQVVERVETVDRISGNRFVTRYAYHHGYFDGAEREFRGFGLVEQWDTETFAALTETGMQRRRVSRTSRRSSHAPGSTPARTWVDTGRLELLRRVQRRRRRGEYYREPGLTDDEARALLLADTVLPPRADPGRGARGLPCAQGSHAAPGGLRAGRS